jgi:hypothetical protein
MSEPVWKTELHRAIGAQVDPWASVGWLEDAVLETVLPHIEAAFKRGHEAGSSKAGYRLVQENERLRRELALAHQANQRRGVCPTCLSALDASGTTRASAGDPPEGAAP